jgi:hypothetical protein
MSANADIILSQNARFYSDPGVPVVFGPQTFSGDYNAEPNGFALLIQATPIDSSLTINGGSTLFAARGLSTFAFLQDPPARADIVVDGIGSRIDIGGGVDRGSIILQGKGDVYIRNGAVVSWTGTNGCDGSFGACDILIGANNATIGNFSGITNIGITVEGAGSLLDASNTNGRLFVGFTPAEFTGQSEDFLVVRDGGELRSNGAGIGKGWEQPVPWTSADGFLRGLALVDNGSWSISGERPNLNIGEGDGGSGFVAIMSGGVVELSGDASTEAGFYLGQSEEGAPTVGADNLLVVSGDGSRLSIDNNYGQLSGSRIANGAVSVQDQGLLELDSSVLLVSGKTGRAVSSFFSQLGAQLGLSSLPTSRVLEVVSGGALNVTDTDATGINALIIGQTPDAGPTQEANVLVSGTVTVTNDPSQPKIPLGATGFGIPAVSNIGTGSLVIDGAGIVQFQNGDFVVGVGANDDATVSVSNGGQLSADRVVVGLADFDSAGPGVTADETGELVLDNGIVNGDVYIDDNGALRGVGTINGTLEVVGGTVAPGFSPGTITADAFVLGPGSELIIEVALNPDGTIDASASDGIVVSTGTVDLSAGEVVFALSSTEPTTTVEEILTTGDVLEVADLFQATEDVVLASFELTDPSGSISDEELEQRVEVVSFDKTACKGTGWSDVARSDGTGFANQGDCVQYVNTGK